jgi:flavin-dependent dehydrogenase
MGVYDFDVLVIGGGPAGSAVATFLQKNNLRVAVVERSEFPRFRIGESLLPEGNQLLKELGVWPAVEKAGFIPKFGALFYTADGRVEREVVFSQGIIKNLNSTFQVERARFDALLLKNAQMQGVQVEMGATVRSVTQSNGGYLIKVAKDGLPARNVSACWVVDASGRDQFFPSEIKRSLDPAAQPKRVAIYSHFTGVPRRSGSAAGHTIIVRLADGWFWVIPIDAERTSVGLVTTVQSMREGKQEPAEFFQRAVAESPKLRELMANAESTMPFHVTSDYSYFRRSLASERMILVGDAAGFFDPIFSSGVYVAMYSAKVAAKALVRAHRANRSLSVREQKRYTQQIKRHASTFLKLINAFYDNDSFSVFMCPSPPLRLDRGVNSIVAGHARLTWSLWWRFTLFLWVCRLQKRYTLVPRINLTVSDPEAVTEAALPHS